ncbi:MAG: HAD hydrolase-like protein [Prochlorococcus marinus XMU1422]|nr:HAD hydrolase-like protein [Prochlorococcus marinus XMU1421]MBO7013273.1 HAD hydrolase-like protein [Prochlorococcus marinus XMU1422]MCR8542272.1 HAD hydrolase-like protein [Prochlorococcus marinus XMU1423]
MIKLIIFDLDGVLIDSKDFHFEALNLALGEEFAISKEEHITEYDGLPTIAKLKLLSEKKGLPSNKFEQIWRKKQDNTIKIFKNSISKDYELMNYFQQLTNAGYKIAVASNSIRNTVKIILLRLGLLEFVDIYVSNEDIVRNKPYPEMYWKCMITLGAIPENTVIVEDSIIGRQGAIDSKCHLIPVENRKDLNQAKIEHIKKILESDKKKTLWENKSMNILIPMAGRGSRFESKGYTFPKPLIDVKGKPMIQVVVDNLNIKAKYIFIVQKEHYEKYNLQYLLNLIAPECNIVQVDGITEGAACTTLLAKKFINNDEPLLMANSDQFIEWDSSKTLYAFSNSDYDGGILTFPSSHPKWSYAKLDDNGFVSKVAEKKPISKNATVGIYWWKKGSEYVKYAEQMIKKDIRTNNEFYVCPVFNEAIDDGKKIIIREIEKEGMWGIGTPEDLDYFIENYNGDV